MIDTTNHTDNELLQAVKTVVRTKDPNAQIILFGSQARGDYSEESDWDIMVVSDKISEKTYKDFIFDKLYDIELEFETIIQLFIFPKSRWETGESPTPLYDNVRAEGIKL